MKIAVMSDLHLEFDARMHNDHGLTARNTDASNFLLGPPRPNADVLVLAGDIHNGGQGIDWATRNFPLPTVIIAGNHEAYGHELFRVIAYNRQKANATNGRIVFLERATWIFTSPSGERARFVGATLWTDFQLSGNPKIAMEIATAQIEDFRVVKVERGYQLRLLRPSDSVRLHRASVAFLRRELEQPFDGTTIVVTHHAPSPQSIAAKYRNNPLNPAFASDLDSLISTYEPSLWVHGHMHDSFDYKIGRTRIVCNPRGYFPDQLNPSFDPHLVIEVPT